jgi:hypothetical protein
VNRLLKIILYTVYILIVVGLIAVIFADFNSSKDKPGGSISKTTTHVVSKVKSKARSVANTSSKTIKQATTKANSSPKSLPNTSSIGTAQSVSSQNLTNTGPGDVIGLFAVIVIVSTLMHWRYQMRKLY